MSKITITSTPKNRISINSQKQGIITVASHGLTGAGSSVIRNLRQLDDVDATQLSNNEILVYDQVSDKFIVEELPIINGGNF
jgi:hypothetical protein